MYKYKFEVRKCDNKIMVVVFFISDISGVDNVFEVEDMNFDFIESKYPNIENFSVSAAGDDNYEFGRTEKLSSILKIAAQAI